MESYSRFLTTKRRASRFVSNATPASVRNSGRTVLLPLLLMIMPRLAPGATQSLVLGNAAATYSVPNAAPFTGLQSYWFDVRIHDYSIPSGACNNFVNVGGAYYQNSGATLQLCDPAYSGGGVFRLFGPGNLVSQNALLVNPPGLQIIAATGSNPVTVTLGAPPFGVSMNAGQNILISGVTDSGCLGLNGVQTIRSVSGQTLTLTADGTGCSYSSGAGKAFSEDILVRFHADRTTNKMTMETWNVDGTGYTASGDSGNVSAWNTISFPQGGIPIGPAPASLAYLRWCGGTIGLNAKAPGGTAQPCSGGSKLADWEFDGNGTDSGPNHLNLNVSNGNRGVNVPFSGSPAYVPACNPGAAQVFRAGTAGNLDGSQSFPLDGGSTLSFQWQQTGSTEPGVTSWQNLRWTGQNTPNPSISGYLAGPVNLRLTVADSSGQTATCLLRNGAVATDDNGNVILPSGAGDPTGGYAKMAGIIGPLTQLSANPRWPWLDQIAKTWADRLAGFQGQIIPGGVVTDFVDLWNTAQAGTAGVVHGSRTVNGFGTQFQTLFCGGAGNTTPALNSAFVGWYDYTVPGGGGGTGRRYNAVAGCPSQTTLTLSSPWVPPSHAGMSYSMWNNSGLASWLNGSANLNYYDNVLAFYAMYFRTGTDTYLHAARWLADRWWTMPYVDRGNSNDCAANASLCNNSSLFPRISAYTGLYLRAIDQDMVAGIPGSSPMWSGIRQFVNGVFRYTYFINGSVGDLRETAYSDMYVALCAAYDPDPAVSAACRTDVASSINTVWKPARQSDGHWQSFAGDYSNVGFSFPDVGNRSNGTVSVSPGSKIVTISGGTWDPSWFPRRFFSFYSWNDSGTRDASFYNATYLDANRIQLDRAYSDNCTSGSNSCTGRSWVISSGWIGFGTQPFMLGIAGHWFNQAYIGLSRDPAYDATAALARSYVVDAANWIATCTLDGTGGCDPATRGAFYGVGFGVCTPGASDGSDSCRCGPANGNCGGTGASRENMGEALGELSIAYNYAPSPSLQAAIDNVLSAAYAKYPTDPAYDGNYAVDLDTGFLSSNNPKWFGFFWGMGRNMTYLSSRQGGAAAPQLLPLKVDVRIGSVTGAVAVRVTPTAPDGTARAPAVCSASPCQIMVDKVMGNWVLQVDHISATGATLSKGIPYVVRWK